MSGELDQACGQFCQSRRDGCHDTDLKAVDGSIGIDIIVIKRGRWNCCVNCNFNDNGTAPHNRRLVESKSALNLSHWSLSRKREF